MHAVPAAWINPFNPRVSPLTLQPALSGPAGTFRCQLSDPFPLGHLPCPPPSAEIAPFCSPTMPSAFPALRPPDSELPWMGTLSVLVWRAWPGWGAAYGRTSVIMQAGSKQASLAGPGVHAIMRERTIWAMHFALSSGH